MGAVLSGEVASTSDFGGDAMGLPSTNRYHSNFASEV
jgi:hypothetical protein